MDTRTNAQNLQLAWQGLSEKQSLSQKQGADGCGSLYVFTSPTSKIGTSFVTRSMALMAAAELPKGKKVLIVDMDIQFNAPASWFFEPEAQAQYGNPERPSYNAGQEGSL